MPETEIVSMNALEAITGAEINSQVATARRFPRDVAKSIRRATELATMTPEIAEECHFSLPRGGKDIEGPSVRLAEILASTWTNLRVGARVLEIGEREVVCQGVAFDAESNVAISKEVRRPIVYSAKGERAGVRYADDQIMLTANAGSSIAFRNAVFACVPQAIWWPVYEAALRTMHDGKVPMIQRVQKALAWFKARGVDTQAVLRFLKVRTIGDIHETEFDRLVGVRNALAEGASTIQDIFGQEAAVESPAAPEEAPTPERRRPGRPRGSTNAPQERAAQRTDLYAAPETRSGTAEEPQPRPEPEPEPGQGEIFDVLKPPAEEVQALWAHWEDLRSVITDPAVMMRICQAAGVQRIHSQLPLEKLQAVIKAAEAEVS